MMIKQLFYAWVVLTFGSACAFQTAGLISRQRVSVFLSSTTATDAATEAFEAYQMTDDQTTVAKLDVKTGNSDLSVEPDKLVTVGYTARLLASGKVIDQGDSFVVRMGAGTLIPGWEQGVMGMKVGGVRKLRVPPNLAYGEKMIRGIPPGSHLEFDIEIKDICASPVDEFVVKLNDFGIGRAAGMVFFLVLAAVAPRIDF